MPPLHDPLNVGFLDVTHKLNVRLKAHVHLMKSAVPKMLREVCDGGVGRRLKQPKASLVAIFGKKKGGKHKKEEEREQQNRRRESVSEKKYK